MAGATQEALESVPANNRQAWRLHHVEAGDTLATIAKSYHLTPERIVAVNESESIEAGETLCNTCARSGSSPTPAARGRRFGKAVTAWLGYSQGTRLSRVAARGW